MSAVFVLEIPIFSCEFGLLLVCKPRFSSVTNTLCIPSTSTDLIPRKTNGLEALNLNTYYPEIGQAFLRNECLKYLEPDIIFEVTS